MNGRNSKFNYLILDEATSALDLLTEAGILTNPSRGTALTQSSYEKILVMVSPSRVGAFS